MAAVRRHLPKAPIVEALIQINVDLPAGTDLGAVPGLHDALKGDFPHINKMFRSKLMVNVQPDSPLVLDSTVPELRGYKFSSADSKRVVQFGADYFTFNWLRPYDTWGALFEATRAVWPLYVQTLHPKTVTRIGLRYINDLALPMPVTDFGQFLSVPPDVPPGLPQSVSEFLDRIVLQDEARGAVAIVTRKLEALPKDGVLPFILDIDTFRAVAVDVDSDDIWETLNVLRGFKNDIFFSSITERLVEMYL
jgi:uncharacterized protein (TIGR04255 family)